MTFSFFVKIKSKHYLYNQAHFKGSIAINARGPTGPSVLIIHSVKQLKNHVFAPQVVEKLIRSWNCID